jgi:hypothetical protein
VPFLFTHTHLITEQWRPVPLKLSAVSENSSELRVANACFCDLTLTLLCHWTKSHSFIVHFIECKRRNSFSPSPDKIVTTDKVVSVTLISGFRSDVEICAFLGSYAASCGNCLPTFRDNVSVPSSRVKSDP